MSVGEVFADTVLNGSMLLAIPVAAIAGVVSFASPCVLPLVPGYLGYVTGLSGVALEEQSKPKLVLGVSLFVLGFSAVFVALGALFGQFGSWLTVYGDIVSRVLGVIVIIMGVAFLGGLNWLQKDVRLNIKPAAGIWGAPFLGIVFGLGWFPCIGPTLAAVLNLSMTASSPMRGAVLALVYCLGLGLPFILVAFGVSRGLKALNVLRRHRLMIQRIGGGLLVAVGLLLVTGLWSVWINQLQGVINQFVPVV